MENPAEKVGGIPVSLLSVLSKRLEKAYNTSIS